MIDDMETRRSQSGTALTRRGFVKGAAFAGALVAATAATGCAPKSTEGEGATTQPQAPEEQVYLNSCHGNCGRSCAWDVTVRDGYIVNAEPHSYDDDPEDIHRGGCNRGLLNIQRIYDADRLKYPMKRVNAKTEEVPEWEQISWDEAIDLIVEKWKAVIDEVGPTGMGLWHVYGSSAFLSGNGFGTWGRLQHVLGADMVVTGADMATIYTMTLNSAVNTIAPDSLREAEAFVFWGANIAETKWPAWRCAHDAREGKGALFYTIDPQSTITALRSDKHITIKPGTDGALALSIMNVIFENGWEDSEFLQSKTCAPYLVKEDWTCLRESDLGIEIEDGEPDRVYVWDVSSNSAKPITEVENPQNMAMSGEFEVEGRKVRTTLDLLKERAASYPLDVCERITSVAPEAVKELAEVISTKRTMIQKDNGHAHYKNSPQTALALDALIMISGNMGKPGCGIYAMYASGPTNPDFAKTGTPGISIPDNKILEVVETGKLGEKDVPLRGLITYAGNIVGSGADRSAIEKALQELDFVAVAEVRMTDTCKYADLLLPVSHWWERDDVMNSGANLPYFRIAEKAVDPPFECLSDYEITRRIAEKMGVGEFFQGSDQDQLAQALDSDANRELGCTYADLQEKKTVRVIPDGFNEAANGVFGTENGRVNFFLDRPKPYVDYGQEIDPFEYSLPDFAETAEVLESSPLAEQYPLIFLTPHTKYGTQTTFHHAPWLHEIISEPEIHINPVDAEARGVADGDYMRIFNDRSELVAKAKFNSGIMPGVTVLYHGWAEEYFKKGHYQSMSSSFNSDDFTNNSSYFDVRVQAEVYKEA